MINIETGYKPEFALGALYQGQNAANAQSQNEEELIRMFLANQHSIQNDPILEDRNRADLVSARYGAKRDQAKMDDPQFIPQLLAGEKGQWQSTEASGAKAKALLPFEMALAKEIAAGGLDKAKLDSLFNMFNLNAAQPQEQQPAPEASIPEGFSMPNGGVSSAGRNAFFPATATPNPGDPAYLGVAAKPMEMPFQPNGKPVQGPSQNFAGNLTAGREAQAELLASELKHATPERKAAILREIATMQKTEAGGYRGNPAPVSGEGSAPAPVFSNMIAPTHLADNSGRERVMNVMTDTPEFRQKQIIAKQAQDAAAAKSAANSAALLALAEARARSQQGKEPTTAEAAKTRLILNDPNLDPATRDALLNEIMNAKYGMGKNAEGQQFGIRADGNKVTPGMQAVIPPISGTTGARPKPPEGMTMEKLKAQYPPGTSEDKLRAAYKLKYGVSL